MKQKIFQIITLLLDVCFARIISDFKDEECYPVRDAAALESSSHSQIDVDLLLSG